MTDQELRDLVAHVAQTQAETNKQIKELGRQIGDLGNKFGSFAEGMALPSMEKVLKQRFGMNDVGPRRRFFLNGETLEVDVFGFDNTGKRKEAYVVEVKSRLKNGDIEQLLNTINELPRFFPSVRDCKIYGILAAVDIPDNLRAEALKAGLYLARISDNTFKLQVPPNFKPHPFIPTKDHKNGHQNGHSSRKPKKKK
jgi:hypothetical protein